MHRRRKALWAGILFTFVLFIGATARATVLTLTATADANLTGSTVNSTSPSTFGAGRQCL
jgi:hypothetical protein